MTGQPQAATWFVEPDRAAAPPLRRRRARPVRRNADATSFRAVIVASLFLVPLATSLLLGGHAAIEPLLQMAIAARDVRSFGDVVMAMPDGKFCRHMSFDNVTAEVLEGPIERCPDNVAHEMFRSRQAHYFKWDGAKP